MSRASPELLHALNADVALEHEAILLYLLVAWTSGDEEVEGVLEAIAREEMFHLRWLSHLILELGGEVDLSPPEMPDLAGRDPLEVLKEDVAHEAHVIETYEAQKGMTDDPRVHRVLDRLIADSREHQRRLADLIAGWEARRAAAAEEEGPGEEDAPADPERIAALRRGLSDEYTAVLQYLDHAFRHAHGRASVYFEDAAIQEMRHMAEFGEELAEAGEAPVPEPAPIYRGRGLEDRLERNRQDEEEAAAFYRSWIGRDPEGPWRVLAYQEEDHAALWRQMLRELREDRRPRWTVGPLR